MVIGANASATATVITGRLRSIAVVNSSSQRMPGTAIPVSMMRRMTVSTAPFRKPIESARTIAAVIAMPTEPTPMMRAGLVP